MTRNLVPRCMKYYSNRAGQSIWVAWVTGDRGMYENTCRQFVYV